jgi:hypothetical protein
MKPGIRAGAAMVAVIVMATAVLAYLASERMGKAVEAAAEARTAMLHTYRAAQNIKSLIHAYELTINEYYSTVLEFPEYKQKSASLKAAINGELEALARRNTSPATAVAQLNDAFGQIGSLSLELEGALGGANKDWDLAREALYKLNLVSLQAVQSPDIIARVAEERAAAMDAALQDHQAGAMWQLRVAMLLALVAAALILVGAFRSGRTPAQELTGRVGESAAR